MNGHPLETNITGIGIITITIMITSSDIISTINNYYHQYITKSNNHNDTDNRTGTDLRRQATAITRPRGSRRGCWCYYCY